jgi:hypothetical protein
MFTATLSWLCLIFEGRDPQSCHARSINSHVSVLLLTRSQANTRKYQHVKRMKPIMLASSTLICTTFFLDCARKRRAQLLICCSSDLSQGPLLTTYYDLLSILFLNFPMSSGVVLQHPPTKISFHNLLSLARVTILNSCSSQGACPTLAHTPFLTPSLYCTTIKIKYTCPIFHTHLLLLPLLRRSIINLPVRPIRINH